MTARDPQHPHGAEHDGPFITKEQLATLPIRRFEGPIHLVDRDDLVPAAAEKIRAEKILGFDIETRPSFRVGESHPPALLQLCGQHEAWVIQLLKLRDAAPLIAILADDTITKAGVALSDDLKKLRSRHDFAPASFIEIAHLARERGYKQTGLRALCGLLFHFRMSKREQRSNWAAPQLTPGQIAYAATDAWASRELLLALRKIQPLEPAAP